jgi:hypothetical protein
MIFKDTLGISLVDDVHERNGTGKYEDKSFILSPNNKTFVDIHNDNFEDNDNQNHNLHE